MLVGGLVAEGIVRVRLEDGGVVDEEWLEIGRRIHAHGTAVAKNTYLLTVARRAREVAASMSTVFVDIDISLDGYIAGPNASSENPLGDGGDRLIWYGDDVNDPAADFGSSYGEADAQVLERSAAREGAVIMGRRTFDVSIEAWGADPPIAKPCFVLTHRPLPTLTRGRTTFHFVADPIDALHRAAGAARERDVGIMGGADTIRQYLARGLVDELNLHLVPVLLGGGIRLFDERRSAGFELRLTEVRSGTKAAHLSYAVSIATMER